MGEFDCGGQHRGGGGDEKLSFAGKQRRERVKPSKTIVEGNFHMEIRGICIGVMVFSYHNTWCMACRQQCFSSYNGIS